MDPLELMRKRLYAGDVAAVSDLVQEALAQGITGAEILDGGLMLGMEDVGRDFKKGDLFLPEVLAAARAMHVGMDILRPVLIAEGAEKSQGRLVIGTVKGDLHDIGKNLVSMMMKGAGFEVVDLGVDVPPEHLVEAVREYTPDVVGMSALLTTTMWQMKASIDALRRAGLRDQVKVLVGGAPVTEAYAEEIGADAYAANAVTAVEKARLLLEL